MPSIRSIALLAAIATLPLASFAADPTSAVPAPAAGEDEVGSLINHATCTQGGDERQIEIVTTAAGRHQVNYIRGKDTKEIGGCATKKERCQQVFDRTKSNLEKSGFTCKS